jgi:hypothetical protein
MVKVVGNGGLDVGDEGSTKPGERRRKYGWLMIFIAEGRDRIWEDKSIFGFIVFIYTIGLKKEGGEYLYQKSKD